MFRLKISSAKLSGWVHCTEMGQPQPRFFVVFLKNLLFLSVSRKTRWIIFFLPLGTDSWFRICIHRLRATGKKTTKCNSVTFDIVTWNNVTLVLQRAWYCKVRKVVRGTRQVIIKFRAQFESLNAWTLAVKLSEPCCYCWNETYISRTNNRVPTSGKKMKLPRKGDKCYLHLDFQQQERPPNTLYSLMNTRGNWRHEWESIAENTQNIRQCNDTSFWS